MPFGTLPILFGVVQENNRRCPLSSLLSSLFSVLVQRELTVGETRDHQTTFTFHFVLAQREAVVCPYCYRYGHLRSR